QQTTEIEPRPAQPEAPPQVAVSAPAPALPVRSRKRKLLPLLVIVVLAVAGYLIWKYVFSSQPVPDNIVILSGRLEGDDSAVSPKTSGRILETRYREGDRVNAGDVIATLDDQQIHAREDQAHAALLEAQARLSSAHAQIAVLNEQLQQNQEEVT